MQYFKEIQNQINVRDFTKLLLLWEEYCTNDTVDVEEYQKILQAIKASDFALPFGKYVEFGLPLWETIKDKNDSYKILKLIIDLQTTDSTTLADLAYKTLEEFHGHEPEFKERIRLIGLRSKNSFQGALSNYDLLAHMAIGKCVYHTGGWGTGEIMEISPLREQLAIEFEYLTGRKHITFQNAFKSLIPLPDEHFLARRFVDSENLENEAKEDPIKVIKILLRDLGPKTASEIKDDLCGLVIPEQEWTKWWQNARAKLKKDTLVNTPNSLKEPFYLRTKEMTHEDQLQKEIHNSTNVSEIVQTSYNYVRDFPLMLKKEEVKKSIIQKLVDLLSGTELAFHQELQIYIFFENLLDHHLEKGKSVKELVTLAPNIEDVINDIEIIAFKKRALVAVREFRKDWPQKFLSLLFSLQQSQLRDYVLKELSESEARPLLENELENMLQHPKHAPESLVWYFQKIILENDEDIPFNDKEGRCRFFEALLILLHNIEHIAGYKELTKKIYAILTNKRFATVRQILEGTSLDFVKEFLLLASKCHTFTSQDIKILNSLAQVVFPSLGPEKKVEDRLQLDGRVVWTTEQGYRKTQERAQQIGTVEIVENAREVEAARALGDLRENSEYKFAVERRRQLQNELKRLSEELNRARIITEQDISPEEIGIGNVVEIENENQQVATYTILGPWDADPENNILSFQSKLAQAMIGRKVNDKFSFREEQYKIRDVKSYLDINK